MSSRPSHGRAARAARLPRRLPWARVAVVMLAGCLYVFLSTRIGLDVATGGPDEVMRSLVPGCIVDGNLLPSGYDACAVYDRGYWSYAFYPQLLPSYLSAAFMGAARLLGASGDVVFMSGRLASVCFGMTAVAATGSTVFHALRGRGAAEPAACLASVLMGFWPQFAFLSSYMNNDVAALAGVSLILLALVRGLRDGWSLRPAALMCAGVVVAGLSYWNAYGFVLEGVALFAATAFLQHPGRPRDVLRIVGPAAAVCAACVLPFLLANLVRYGDPVGMSAFHDRYMQWLADGGEPLQWPWQGEAWRLPLDPSFVQGTTESFIALFGYMAVRMPYPVYLAYTLLAGAGAGMFLARIREWTRSARFRLLAASTAAACLITIGLFLYYNLRVDYQSQGRYVIYLLVPLVVASATGVGRSFRFKTPLSRLALLAFTALYTVLCLYCFYYAITTAGWHGI